MAFRAQNVGSAVAPQAGILRDYLLGDVDVDPDASMSSIAANTSLASNISVEIPSVKSEKRYPEFVVYFLGALDRLESHLAFLIVEIKPFDSQAADEEERELLAGRVIKGAKRQVVLQALFTFEEDTTCQQLTTLCCAGEYWQAWQFHRKDQPLLPLSKVTEATNVPLDWHCKGTTVRSLFADSADNFDEDLCQTLHESILNLPREV